MANAERATDPAATSPLRRGRPWWGTAVALAGAAALLGTLGACGADEVTSPAPEVAPVRILRDEPATAESQDAPPAGDLPVVEGTDTLEGLIVNPYDLAVGQCFNSYLTSLGSDDLQELTTLVDCAGAHDGEVYFQVFHPGDADEEYPGETEMLAWAQRHCYGRFAGFVGREYELSDLDIGILRPTFETWSDPWGRHREVTCYLSAWRGGRLVGSMYLSGF